MFKREFWQNLGKSQVWGVSEPQSQFLSPGQSLLIRHSELTFPAFIEEQLLREGSAGCSQQVSSGQTQVRLLLNFAQIPTGHTRVRARAEHPSPVTPSGVPWQEEKAGNASLSHLPDAHVGYWKEISTDKAPSNTRPP